MYKQTNKQSPNISIPDPSGQTIYERNTIFLVRVWSAYSHIDGSPEGCPNHTVLSSKNIFKI